MRDAFRHRQDVLVLQLARMCDLAGLALRRATRALLDNDPTLAHRVVADDPVLDRARDNAQHDAHVLLSARTPVGGDLGLVLSVLRGAEDAERMGDLAHHIAACVLRRHPRPVLPNLLHNRFAQMGNLAVRMAGTAAHLVREPDPVLGTALAHADDEIDALHRSLFPVLSYQGWSHGVPAAVDAVLLSRNYERFADHAVTIAHRGTTAPAGTTGEHTGTTSPAAADRTGPGAVPDTSPTCGTNVVTTQR
ncbi:phosphate signaling complex PhoU family protein [Saccharothrix syringae]|uniref:Phosphate transport system regulatory protein PhoU n=1 Tax=Saccharothrix syringae TaxID=103733 RepID=A0A5Q0GWB4_SACSY|nr:PhoU domain-containing protein [Saccharothrix syringae]QFZ18416.1 phosphate transport system regulatory protein PhoU [Saccharothrix syringae]